MKKMRWAICGTGNMSTRLGKVTHSMPNIEIVACASSSKERAVQYGQQHSLTPYTYEELYQANDIDAVYVCTNNNVHYDNVMGLVANNKAAVCEKPFALNLQQAAQMIQAAHNNKVLLLDAFWTAYLPATAAVKKLVKGQRMGAVKSIKGVFSGKMGQDKAHRIYYNNLGGGCILDLGVYLVGYTHNLMGYPSVIKTTAHRIERGVDLDTKILLEYDCGVVADLHCYVSDSRICHYTIVCQYGTVFIDSFSNAASFTFTTNYGKVTSHEFEQIDGFIYQIRHFIDLYNNGKTESDIYPHNSTLEVSKILTKCLQQAGIAFV